MRYKTDRLKEEFEQLKEKNPELRAALIDIDTQSMLQTNKEITLTSIYRSVEENTAVGGSPVSPHCFWRAADLRASYYTPEQIQSLVDYINKNYTYRHNPTLKPALYHSVPGGAYHFHIQIGA